MLFLVSTPIGNLDDISQRAINSLKECDLIFCEDTRRSSILLDRYGIQKRLLSYHKFNEKQSLEAILSDLESGIKIALISDAGTPCINDPGHLLVTACIEKKIPFTLIPGPCSPIQALVLSGMDTTCFQYIGFIPKSGTKRVLTQALSYPGTTIALESPSRIVDTLKEIHEIDPARKVAIAREMTKTYEECLRGICKELIEHFEKHPPRGEIVLVIAGGGIADGLSVEESIEMLQEFHGLTMKEAIKTAAVIKKIPKREVYQYIQSLKNT
ncbi:MAG TPA: 16S rRNA (cytidine(1402)-2'-O)-methyltransferase [Chlamydiales bacterium]|nr:16S rRNA (cytidine(1402)-2'-O)-methyltransferase [Chlamydiales bacterium]